MSEINKETLDSLIKSAESELVYHTRMRENFCIRLKALRLLKEKEQDES